MERKFITSSIDHSCNIDFSKLCHENGIYFCDELFEYLKDEQSSIYDAYNSLSDMEKQSFFDGLQNKYYFKFGYYTNNESYNDTERAFYVSTNCVELNELFKCLSRYEYLINETNYLCFAGVPVDNIDAGRFLFFNQAPSEMSRTIISDEEKIESLFVSFKNIYNEIYKDIVRYNCISDLLEYIHIGPLDFENIYLNKIYNFGSDFKYMTLNELSFEVLSRLNNADLFLLEDAIFNLEPFNALDFLNDLLNKKLNDAELNVLEKRDFSNSCTLEEIGKEYGVTRERIRQIEAKAWKKIKITCSLPFMKKFFDNLSLRTFANGALLPVEKFYQMLSQKGQIVLDNSGLYRFVREYNLLIEDYSVVEEIERLVKELPEIIHAIECNNLIRALLENSGNIYEYELALLIFNNIYTLYDDLYIRVALSNRIIVENVVRKYFADGIEVYKAPELALFREKAKDMFGIDMNQTDRALVSIIQRYTQLADRGKWKAKEEFALDSGFVDKVVNFVVNSSFPIVPNQLIYDTFINDFNNMGINNRYAISPIVHMIFDGLDGYRVGRDYIYYVKSNANVYELVSDYVKEAKTPLTKEHLMNHFKGLSEVTIGSISHATKVINLNGMFVHLDNLALSNEQVSKLKDAIERIISDSDIHHAFDIYEEIKYEFSGIFSINGIDDYLKFFALSRKLFDDDFNFIRPYIAKKDIHIPNGDILLVNAVKELTKIDIQGFRLLAREQHYGLDSIITFIDSHNDLMFYDSNTIGVTSCFPFDLENINTINASIEKFLSESDYRCLNEYHYYWELPKIGKTWDQWLLYSIINLYSDLFVIKSMSNKMTETVLIVARKSYQGPFEVDSIKDNHSTDYTNVDVLDVLDIDDIY
ncbi:MAG: hypothetical protein K5923_01810 [Clostridia bacterium]|nr:hypothetical protein [Clostridia bacterium]